MHFSRGFFGCLSESWRSLILHLAVLSDIVKFQSNSLRSGWLSKLIKLAFLADQTHRYFISGTLSSRSSARIAKAEGSASSFLEQVLSSIRIVKVFQASDELIAIYDKFLGEVSSVLRLFVCSEINSTFQD